jgi:hypothetical protein
MKYIINLLAFSMLLIPAYSQDAYEIIRKANDLMRGESSSGIMSMEIIRPKWTRKIEMKSWAKGEDYSLIIVTQPARDKGTGFLKREKELWNWQPRIDRVVKLPPSMMMQSWMGSDFTNDDLVRESSIVDDYTHSVLTDTTIGEYKAWKIEMIPKEETAVVWGKIEIYIEKDNYYQLLIKYYDEDDFLINTMKLSEIRKMGDRVIPTRMEMIPSENPDQKTVVIYEDYDFGIDIETSFFSIQNLKNIR